VTETTQPQTPNPDPPRVMGSISDAQLGNWFSYHAPKGTQQERYVKIREYGLYLAKCIRDNTPIGADQTAAIRKVREAVMTANAAIACGE
jgi:hypothetical protein